MIKFQMNALNQPLTCSAWGFVAVVPSYADFNLLFDFSFRFLWFITIATMIDIVILILVNSNHTDRCFFCWRGSMNQGQGELLCREW